MKKKQKSLKKKRRTRHLQGLKKTGSEDGVDFEIYALYSVISFNRIVLQHESYLKRCISRNQLKVMGAFLL